MLCSFWRFLESYMIVVPCVLQAAHNELHGSATWKTANQRSRSRPDLSNITMDTKALRWQLALKYECRAMKGIDTDDRVLSGWSHRCHSKFVVSVSCYTRLSELNSLISSPFLEASSWSFLIVGKEEWSIKNSLVIRYIAFHGSAPPTSRSQDK